MINYKITGDLRAVANAAWISTMDQSKAEQRTDEDVDRVTTFLAKNAHSSPFEAVTVTVSFNEADHYNLFLSLKSKRFFRHVKCESVHSDGPRYNATVVMTTDLLNFYKLNYEVGLGNPIWSNFSAKYKDLAGKITMLPLNPDSGLSMSEDAEDQTENFSNSNIEVDLVSVHQVSSCDSHTRITWRVKCPLSIGVQMLRHRTASFNMVSGRYKTIRQEFTTTSEDLIRIFENSDLLPMSKELRAIAAQNKDFYLSFMKKLAQLKRSDEITNDEYKRCREFVRFILPEGRMTELYVTFYKEDFNHFLKLRNNSHTQPEHIYVAQLMKKTYEDYLK